MKLKSWLGVLLVGCCLMVSGCNQKDMTKGTIEGYSYEEIDVVSNYVKIVTNKDKVILIELYPEEAPKTVENFQKLVKEEFYNGVIFHRVIKGFMIQTGDGTPLGKEAKTIKGEFKSNGVENNLSHERGIVSMARANDYNSGSSQFFIVQEDSTYLDGNYAAFGKVIAGMDVVDSIANVITDENDKPLKDIVVKRIYFVKVVD